MRTGLLYDSISMKFIPTLKLGRDLNRVYLFGGLMPQYHNWITETKLPKLNIEYACFHYK